jgi:predicted Zn-dependent protease
MKKLNIAIKISSLFVFLLSISTCAVNPVTGKKQVMMMSESQEVDMGRQYDPEVLATFGKYQDDKLNAYIQEKGREIAKISHRPGIEYYFKVIDSPVVNAFAVPGGYVYITRGILAQLNNEAELMGVMAHELGHIAARHSVSQQSNQQMGQLLLIGGMIASDKFAEYGQYAMQGMQLLFMKFSRDDEREADRLGVEYSSKLGFDAHKMADFFQVLNKMNLADENAGVPTFLSTHPDPGDRYVSVNKQAKDWQDSLKYPSWKVNSDSYLQMIDGIIYGEDPRQGYVEANTFYHPELKIKFSFPAGWKIDNSPIQVRMMPQDGKALMVFTISPEETMEEAAKYTAEQLQMTIQESKKITINGLPAVESLSKQVITDQSTGQTSTNLILSCYIECGSYVYVFHGVSSETDFKSYFSSLESAMTTFSRLTEPSKINVKPNKLLVKKVQNAGTLSDAFRFYGVPQAKMNEIALLNNLELTDKVQAGRLIKIIGQ